VYQELNPSGQHDVASNVFMGREPVVDGRLKCVFRHVDRDRMEREAVDALDEIGFRLDPRAKTAELSGGQQQAIAVARALISDPEIVLMDEPTAEVSVENSERILDLIGRLREQGRTVIFMSQNPRRCSRWPTESPSSGTDNASRCSTTTVRTTASTCNLGGTGDLSASIQLVGYALGPLAFVFVPFALAGFQFLAVIVAVRPYRSFSASARRSTSALANSTTSIHPQVLPSSSE